MWSLLVAFGQFLLNLVFRGVIIKFVLLTALVYAVAALAALAFDYLVNADLLGLQNALGALPDGLWFFLHIFQVHVGIPLMIGAVVARFAIRRLPVIG